MSPQRSRKSVVEIGGQQIELSAPGLKQIRRKLTTHLYWAADEAEVCKGYLPRTVRIHVDLSLSEPEAVSATCAIIEDICQREQQAMLSWADGNRDDRKRLKPRFDGTIGSLAQLYKSDPESGFQYIKANSQANYSEWLTIVEKTIGHLRISFVPAKYFRTCFEGWVKPAKEGGPERERRAYGCIQMVRVLLDYGIQADLPACRKLRDAMEKIRFPTRAPRDETMLYAQAKAVVEMCLRENNKSMALAQAIQWDTMMRQRDVIGQWRFEPEDHQLKPGEIRKGKLVWSGLTIDKIVPGGLLEVRTSKKGQPVLHLIDECKLVMHVIPFIDRSVPNAPVAVTSQGQPWGDHRAFGKAWRRYADKAGLPKTVWNMDARASGVTEASAGGAKDDDIASNVGHASKLTTRRIYKRKAPQISRRVQESRRAARAAEE
jgi:hypothetical protein